MLKTWLKGFEMKDINVYFSVDDVHTLKEWSGHISSAVSNPYLTGYRPLDKLWFYYKYSFPLSGSIKNVPDHRIGI